MTAFTTKGNDMIAKITVILKSLVSKLSVVSMIGFCRNSDGRQEAQIGMFCEKCLVKSQIFSLGKCTHDLNNDQQSLLHHLLTCKFSSDLRYQAWLSWNQEVIHRCACTWMIVRFLLYWMQFFGLWTQWLLMCFTEKTRDADWALSFQRSKEFLDFAFFHQSNKLWKWFMM